MEIKPVSRYRTPAYATNAILEQHPELLRLVPKRWRSNPVVLSALAGLCMMMVGGRAIAATAKNGGKAKPTPASRVAPIFVHGEGRAAFGCVAVSPPVFLSEDEARQVIVEEAKKSGIELKPDAQTLPKVAVPITDGYGFLHDKKDQPPRTKLQPLGLDGTDNKRHISYEFVSAADFGKWEKRSPDSITVYAVDIAGTAKTLRDGLVRAKPQGTYVVFYDPGVGGLELKARRPAKYAELQKIEDYHKQFAEMEVEERDIAHEELRAQVKDFIKWLKSQGVI